MCECVQLFISGLVQGVFFRASACRKAEELQLTGFARNCPDGNVEVMAEGEVEKLKQLIEWCRQGPPGARVTEVRVVWKPATNQFQRFTVK